MSAKPDAPDDTKPHEQPWWMDPEARSPYQEQRDRIEATGTWPDPAWGPFHRHFGEATVREDAECPHQYFYQRRVYVFDADTLNVHERTIARAAAEEQTPIPMRLPCPSCGKPHIDEGDFATKPHHTHACQDCGEVWRPAIPATVGVRFLPGFKNVTDPEPSADLIAAYTEAHLALEREAAAIVAARPDDFMGTGSPATAVALVLDAMWQVPDKVPSIAAYFARLAKTRTEATEE